MRTEMKKWLEEWGFITRHHFHLRSKQLSREEPVEENAAVASIRDDGEPEGRPFSTKGVCTLVQPLHRTIYWLVRPANGALVSCTKADTTPARKELRGLSQGEGCSPHGIVRRSGERCCSLSHSRKLWWNDEGCRAAVFYLSGHCSSFSRTSTKANIPFDHTEGVERFAVHWMRRMN